MDKLQIKFDGKSAMRGMLNSFREYGIAKLRSNLADVSKGYYFRGRWVSAEGDAPNDDTGALSSSIRGRIVGNALGIGIGNSEVVYANPLEYKYNRPLGSELLPDLFDNPKLIEENNEHIMRNLR